MYVIKGVRRDCFTLFDAPDFVVYNYQSGDFYHPFLDEGGERTDVHRSRQGTERPDRRETRRSAQKGDTDRRRQVYRGEIFLWVSVT